MIMRTELPPSDQPQNDPDEINDPRPSERGSFDVHTWTSLNQIFEKLGGIDQKIDQLSSDHKALKASVEKHDKFIVRAGFAIAGAIAVISALWFVYENFLKDHIVFK